jgi:hypothetical protein
MFDSNSTSMTSTRRKISFIPFDKIIIPFIYGTHYFLMQKLCHLSHCFKTTNFKNVVISRAAENEKKHATKQVVPGLESLDGFS